MVLKGKCKVLRVFVDEELKWKGKLLYRAIVERMLELKMAGATVFKGVEGFGSSAHLHSARILEMTENLPMLIEVVDSPKRVAQALKAIEPMLPTHCLVTVQDVQVLHYHRPQGERS